MCCWFFLLGKRTPSIIARIGAAALAISRLHSWCLVALKTFSSEELRQAREGMAFFSPFVASWAKKLKRDP